MNLKLGKLAVKHDTRTLQLRMFLPVKLPPIPDVFDVDTTLPCQPALDVLANDVLGDCVMAERGHQTRRFEAREQGCLALLPDKAVLASVKREYKKEGHGLDQGLVVLDSLNCWRKGWTINTRQYCIYAFGEIHPSDYSEVRATIYLLQGVCAGVELPISAQSQFENGQPWDVVAGSKGKPGSWGGHCIYLVGYNATGPVCVTWGKKQQLTWAFVSKYMSEAYGIVDNRDKWLGSSTLDVDKLDSYLQEVSQ